MYQTSTDIYQSDIVLIKYFHHPSPSQNPETTFKLNKQTYECLGKVNKIEPAQSITDAYYIDHHCLCEQWSFNHMCISCSNKTHTFIASKYSSGTSMFLYLYKRTIKASAIPNHDKLIYETIDDKALYPSLVSPHQLNTQCTSNSQVLPKNKYLLSESFYNNV